MKILAISTWFPYPPDRGVKMRAYHLLSHLGRHHAVDLLAVSQGPQDTEYMDDVLRFCRRAGIFPARKFRPESNSALWRLFTSVPRCFEARHNPPLEAEALRWTSGERYDAVLAVTLGGAPYALKVDVPYRVLDQHNVESLIIKRQWERECSAIRRIRYAPTWVKAARYERLLASGFDLIAVVSDHERALMERLIRNGHRKRIQVIPNGVDSGLLAYPSCKRRENTLVFTGSITYDANHDAVDWLAREVLPAIRQRVPNARLVVTGGYCGVDISGYASVPGMEFTGHLDDIRPVVASASALIVPLRYGGGTRLKILEAMGLGTPVVSTPVGAEGLEVRDGEHILLGESAEELAARTARLLSDPGLAGRLSRAAREMVRREYQWPDIAARFEAAVRAGLDEKRGVNGDRLL